MRLYELFQKEDKDNVTQLKPQTKGTKYPLFSKENAQKAYNEYYNGAAVDTDIDIVGKDNKVYVIRQNRDGDIQHFDPGHWYLTDANNKIVDFERPRPRRTITLSYGIRLLSKRSRRNRRKRK